MCCLCEATFGDRYHADGKKRPEQADLLKDGTLVRTPRKRGAKPIMVPQGGCPDGFYCRQCWASVNKKSKVRTAARTPLAISRRILGR